MSYSYIRFGIGIIVLNSYIPLKLFRDKVFLFFNNDNPYISSFEKVYKLTSVAARGRIKIIKLTSVAARDRVKIFRFYVFGLE